MCILDFFENLYLGNGEKHLASSQSGVTGLPDNFPIQQKGCFVRQSF